MKPTTHTVENLTALQNFLIDEADISLSDVEIIQVMMKFGFLVNNQMIGEVLSQTEERCFTGEVQLDIPNNNLQIEITSPQKVIIKDIQLRKNISFQMYSMVSSCLMKIFDIEHDVKQRIESEVDLAVYGDYPTSKESYEVISRQHKLLEISFLVRKTSSPLLYNDFQLNEKKNSDLEGTDSSPSVCVSEPVAKHAKEAAAPQLPRVVRSYFFGFDKPKSEFDVEVSTSEAQAKTADERIGRGDEETFMPQPVKKKPKVEKENSLKGQQNQQTKWSLDSTELPSKSSVDSDPDPGNELAEVSARLESNIDKRDVKVISGDTCIRHPGAPLMRSSATSLLSKTSETSISNCSDEKLNTDEVQELKKIITRLSRNNSNDDVKQNVLKNKVASAKNPSYIKSESANSFRCLSAKCSSKTIESDMQSDAYLGYYSNSIKPVKKSDILHQFKQAELKSEAAHEARVARMFHLFDEKRKWLWHCDEDLKQKMNNLFVNRGKATALPCKILGEELEMKEIFLAPEEITKSVSECQDINLEALENCSCSKSNSHSEFFEKSMDKKSELHKGMGSTEGVLTNDSCSSGVVEKFNPDHSSLKSGESIEKIGLLDIISTSSVSLKKTESLLVGDQSEAVQFSETPMLAIGSYALNECSDPKMSDLRISSGEADAPECEPQVIEVEQPQRSMSQRMRKSLRNVRRNMTSCFHRIHT